MLAPPPRIWPAPPPAHVNSAAAGTRYGYSSLAQILPSPQDKGDEPQAVVAGGVFPEEPVKHRKEGKQSSTTDWRRKERSRIKTEPGVTPCQVQEVTTSSKHEQSGNSIPVGIAVARQRIQQSTPPPLTVLTCEERSTNQVTGWSGPPHWQYPGVEQSLPVQVPPLQLGRDPISGQLVILPSGNLGDSMQRTVLWPGGSTTGGGSQPPPLVMPSPQPVLLSDRYVTLAPPPSTAPTSGHHHHHHHHQEKRRSHDHSTTTIHGSSTGGLAVGLFPPPPPPQAPFLMMPFSHQNNSLLLSTHLTEHNLNTMVVTNHQLSESAVLNPMEVLTSPVDGFGGGSMIQQLPPSVVISHTETNSFVRSDINAVYPPQHQEQTQTTQPHQPSIQQEQIVVKEEIEQGDETVEEEAAEEEVKAEVMDASNQTESPAEDEEESEVEEEVVVKVEDKACTTVEEEPQEPDISGLELLSSIAQFEKRSSSNEESFESTLPEVPQKCEEKIPEEEWNEDHIQEGIKSGLGLLCSVAERCLEEEVVEECYEPKTFSSTIDPIDDNFSDKKNEDEDLSDVENISNDCEKTSEKESRLNVVPEKKGEWFASTEKSRDKLKMKISRRPGRPRKKIKIRKRKSPNRCEPPVLQPWSASPDGATSPLTSPPTLTPHKRKLSHDLSQESDEGSSSSGGHPPPLSPACSSPSSSKKRKVGRPKKRGDESPQETELMVTKSIPSSKAIGRILASKSGISNHTPPPSPPPSLPNIGSQNKIKPKLKAEAKVKDWHDDEELDLSPGKENGLDDPLPSRSPLWKSPTKLKAMSLSPPRKPKIKVDKKLKKEEEAVVIPDPVTNRPADPIVAKSLPQVVSIDLPLKPPQRPAMKTATSTPLVKPQKTISKSPQHPPSPPSQPSPKRERCVTQVPDCKLTEEQLKSLPCRILSITNGQFYPGEVTKIIAPDIYEVHIYKERCRKPQILCRDEILSSSVAEIHCPEDMFLPSGTRVCAYWSQQYSCFYPGRVVFDSASGQVPIDFDDGDNGTIERTSVRFLPQDYPLVEPQNPLGKRKRYNSTTSSDSHKNNDTIETCTEPENISISSAETEEKMEIKPEYMENNKEKINGETSQDEAEKNSVIDGDGADEIMSVLQSEKEEALEKERKNRHGEKIHKHHKHHKHREGCKTHKCKHKHLRSRKHKHSRDDLKKKENESGPDKPGDIATSNSNCDKEDKEKNKDEEISINGSINLPPGSKSKIAAFLPEKHEMWSWVGAGVKRGRPLGPRGKGLRICYKAIQRGKEVISVGDCAVFVSTGRPDRPFIGHIESFWQYQMKKNMTVRVSWFYHPEETIGCPDKLPYPGGLFRSPHLDNNDVQTISHRCEVLPFTKFHEKAGAIPGFVDSVYENHETYYLAGHYEPAATKLDLEPEVEAECIVKGLMKNP